MENKFFRFFRIVTVCLIASCFALSLFAQSSDDMSRNFRVATEELSSVDFSSGEKFSDKKTEREITLPVGYGGVTLGMSFEDTKEALLKNREFGYKGERDVSLLPGENRALIETDAIKHHVYSFLDRCWFQFADEKLEVITINLNQERMDHYSVFSALCKKYGNPNSLSPQKSVWQNDDVIMSLERPLTIKYVASGSGEGLGGEAPLSGMEITRESFLNGL